MYVIPKGTSVENGVILHLHADELLADVAAIMAGESYLKGIVTAPRIFQGNVEKHDPAWWRAQKRVCLGGGGDFPDEHRNGLAERLRGTSSCKLTSESLWITDPCFLQMVEEINHFDSHTGCPKSHLASIIKMAKIKSPAADALNYVHFTSLMKTVFKKMKLNLPRAPREPSFGDFVLGTMQGKTSFDNNEALTGLVKLVEEESASHHPLIFSSRHIFESLWRTAPGTTKAEKLKTILHPMLTIIDVLYWDQINFHAYRKEAMMSDYDGWFKVDLWNGSCVVPILGAFAQTDNPQAHNALRSLGAFLTIVRNSNGNVTILGNHKLAGQRRMLDAMDLGIKELTAMNRFLDTPVEKRKDLVWSTLQCRGDSPVEDFWYHAGSDDPRDDKWLAAYNGTVNHPRSATKVRRQTMIKNCQFSFHPLYAKDWRRANGAPETDWIKRVELPLLHPGQGMVSMASAFSDATPMAKA